MPWRRTRVLPQSKVSPSMMRGRTQPNAPSGTGFSACTHQNPTIPPKIMARTTVVMTGQMRDVPRCGGRRPPRFAGDRCLCLGRLANLCTVPIARTPSCNPIWHARDSRRRVHKSGLAQRAPHGGDPQMVEAAPKLTRAERSFLASKKVPETLVADMRHRAPWSNCSDELRASGCFFAWGFRVCVDGHRLSNGKGRCIQCHPATIGFVLRHARPGWLYIATTHAGKLTKVGSAANVPERLRQMNAHRLAGVSDWQAVHIDWCDRPASLEAELHRALTQFRKSVTYDRKGGQESREVFACSPAEAITALAEIYAVRPDW